MEISSKASLTYQGGLSVGGDDRCKVQVKVQQLKRIKNLCLHYLPDPLGQIFLLVCPNYVKI